MQRLICERHILYQKSHPVIYLTNLLNGPKARELEMMLKYIFDMLQPSQFSHHVVCKRPSAGLQTPRQDPGSLTSNSVMALEIQDTAEVNSIIYFY